MRVLQIYRSLDTKVGGPARCIPSLSKELSNIGCKTSILTLNYGDVTIAENAGATTIIMARYTRSEFLSTIFNVKKKLNALHGKVDILHLHGIWPPLNWIAYHWAKQTDIPVVVSPHSSLQPWELSNSLISQLKKRIAWSLYAKNILSQCHAVNVTGLNELNALKATGIPSAAALIPIGINTAEFGNLPALSTFHHLFPSLKQNRILLFVSRLHPKKGLTLLAHSWGQIAGEFPGWHLLIVGPDENNHQKDIEKILHSYSVEKRVTFTGHLGGEARLAVYRAAELFVLPTYSENFGIVVPEALFAGIPVITTTETPWAVIEKEDCGWIIPPQIDALKNALRGSMRLPATERERMGQNGKKLVAHQYEAGAIAKEMKILYEWILKERPQPEFVSLLDKGYRIGLPINRPRNLF